MSEEKIEKRIKFIRDRFAKPEEWNPGIDVISADEFNEIVDAYAALAAERDRLAEQLTNRNNWWSEGENDFADIWIGDDPQNGRGVDAPEFFRAYFKSPQPSEVKP